MTVRRPLLNARLWRLAVATMASVAASACLNLTTVIRVSPDGSGTIQQTLLFNPDNIGRALEGLGMKSTSNSATGSEKPPVDEATVRESVSALGDGVTLVSVIPVKLPDGYRGVSAKFAFPDITKLNTSEFLAPGPARTEMQSDPTEMIRFSLQKTAQGTTVLTATFDEKPRSSGKASAKAKSGTGGPDLADPDSQDMVRALFKGFKIGLDLEVAGTIVQTKADYVLGKRITLFEVDLEALATNPGKMGAVDTLMSDDAPIGKLRNNLKDVKGLKINRPVTSVEFR